MNAIEKIIEKADLIFEKAWKNEVKRWHDIKNEVENWNNSEKGEKFGKAPSDSFVALTYLGIHENFVRSGMYNILKLSEYNKMKAMVSELYTMNRKGIDQFLSDKREEYFNMLTAKLKDSLNKHLDDTWKIKEEDDIKFGNSAKGYTVAAIVTKENKRSLLTTICIPAGGYNIQIFHYRYKSKLNEMPPLSN